MRAAFQLPLIYVLCFCPTCPLIPSPWPILVPSLCICLPVITLCSLPMSPVLPLKIICSNPYFPHVNLCRCGSRRGPGARTPFDPRFWGPKIEHFWALFNFSIIFSASLCLTYYFFNMLFFQNSNSKIFQPRFTRHMISHLQVFVLVFVSHILGY